MYFMYADASGNPSTKDSEGPNRFYIISSVIVHEGQRESYCKLVDNMKKILLPNAPATWELHAVEIWNRKDQFYDIDEKKQVEIFQSVVELISELNVSIITVVVPKDKVRDLWKSGILATSWTVLVEQFEQYLSQKRSDTNAGLVCADRMDPAEMKDAANMIAKFAKRGTYYQRSKHVVGCVDFLDSRESNFIQLADVVAYITHKYWKGDPQFRTWYEALKPKTYPKGGSSPLGLRLSTSG